MRHLSMAEVCIVVVEVISCARTGQDTISILFKSIKMSYKMKVRLTPRHQPDAQTTELPGRAASSTC